MVILSLVDCLLRHALSNETCTEKYVWYEQTVTDLRSGIVITRRMDTAAGRKLSRSTFQTTRSEDGERLEGVVSYSLAIHDAVRVALPNETPSVLA